jgi:restriction system protein
MADKLMPQGVPNDPDSVPHELESPIGEEAQDGGEKPESKVQRLFRGMRRLTKSLRSTQPHQSEENLPENDSSSGVSERPGNSRSSPTDADQHPSADVSRLSQAVDLAIRHAGGAAAKLREVLVNSSVAGIRSVAQERDRDEILRWFVNARQLMADEKLSKSAVASELYKSINTLRVAQLLASIATTSLTSYRQSKLPLALKIALPVTAAGTVIFGAQGAGIAAFGGAIGAPVVLLLFLGTAGATSIIEAFIRDRSVRDPLTRLMLTFVEFESSRRAQKEFLAAMRADAMTPLRAVVPPEHEELMAFLFQMDPIAFERHVMSFFEEAGYPTGLTARSNDFGVDGYVFDPDGIVIVQCKRYSADNAVGRPDIQKFKGVVEEQRALRGYFVTTSRFTDEAIRSAEMSDRIELIDGKKLCDWHIHGFSKRNPNVRSD